MKALHQIQINCHVTMHEINIYQSYLEIFCYKQINVHGIIHELNYIKLHFNLYQLLLATLVNIFVNQANIIMSLYLFLK